MVSEYIEYLEENDYNKFVELFFDDEDLNEDFISGLDNNSSDFIEFFNGELERENNYLKRRDRMTKIFPNFNDESDLYYPNIGDRDNLVESLLVVVYILENLEYYISSLDKEINSLEDYLYGNSNERGEEMFKKLTKGNSDIEDKLLNSIDKWDGSIKNYNYEVSQFRQRDIKNAGLPVIDAIDCLAEFRRTADFIDSICRLVEEDTRFLEHGIGTGIMCFSASLCGSNEVFGIEINPISFMLSEVIKLDLEEKNIIQEDCVEFRLGNSLKVGDQMHSDLSETNFDIIVNENMYSGMFYEKAIEISNNNIENNLVDTNDEFKLGDSKAIPKAFSSCIRPVELSDKNCDIGVSETRLDLNKQNINYSKILSSSMIYDQLDMTRKQPLNLKSILRFKIEKSGVFCGFDIYSIIKLNEGKYIDREENGWLGNDHFINLNKNINVERGDEIIVSLAYTQGDNVEDIVLEVRKDDEQKIPEEYYSRENLTEEDHIKNKKEFKKKNNIKQDLKLDDIGDGIRIKSSSYYDDYEKVWLKDIIN